MTSAVIKRIALALAKYHGDDEGSASSPHYVDMAKVAHLASLSPQPTAQKTPARGRPKITEQRPWEAQGISRRTYYRRLKVTTEAGETMTGEQYLDKVRKEWRHDE